MKRFRILILVLMAILLPIRGAVAATMLCPGGEGSGRAAVAGAHGHHDMHSDHAASHHHATGDGDVTDGSSSLKHPTTCQFCASGGCMASIVGTVLSLGQPGPTSPVSFPALTAPVPAFQSDGQDRPPRTI